MIKRSYVTLHYLYVTLRSISRVTTLNSSQGRGDGREKKENIVSIGLSTTNACEPDWDWASVRTKDSQCVLDCSQCSINYCCPLRLEQCEEPSPSLIDPGPISHPLLIRVNSFLFPQQLDSRIKTFIGLFLFSVSCWYLCERKEVRHF